MVSSLFATIVHVRGCGGKFNLEIYDQTMFFSSKLLAEFQVLFNFISVCLESILGGPSVDELCVCAYTGVSCSRWYTDFKQHCVPEGVGTCIGPDPLDL